MRQKKKKNWKQTEGQRVCRIITHRVAGMTENPQGKFWDMKRGDEAKMLLEMAKNPHVLHRKGGKKI